MVFAHKLLGCKRHIFTEDNSEKSFQADIWISQIRRYIHLVLDYPIEFDISDIDVEMDRKKVIYIVMSQSKNSPVLL